MHYKELLESGEPVYRETTRFKHFKNPVTSERYFSNYLSYKLMPSLSELEADLAYLGKEQAGYVSHYAFLFFAENQEISAELADYLNNQGFGLSRHLIFTSPVEDLQLKDRNLGGIRIVELDETYLEDYLQVNIRITCNMGKSMRNRCWQIIGPIYWPMVLKFIWP